MTRRGQTVLALVVLAIGGVIAAVLGLFAYMSLTATPLHPDPQQVSSVERSAPSSEWTAAIARSRELVRTGITEQNLPGLSVAIGVNGELVWAEAFGWADLEQRTRVTPDTRFRTGGVSIALTSAAVGMLLETDHLKLDDRIQTHVPSFPEKQWPVTVRQLMAHVAGIRGDNGDEESLVERCEQTLDGLQRFSDHSLMFEPGTQYRYTTYGWILVSAAVEHAAKEPFFNFMRTRIFEPLGMDRTVPGSMTREISDRATFYYPRFAADTRYGPELAREGDYLCFAGAGAFLSTPSDLVRFGMAIHGGNLLEPATVTLLQTPQRLTSGEETGYGLGWDLETVSLAGQPTRMAGHGSEMMMGGTTTLTTFPERGIVVAIMSNTSFADTSSLATGIAQAFVEAKRSRL
jgi:CubicO group peptidase (beta-lactamase class C family)